MSERPPVPKPPLGVLRIIIAAIGILVMVVSGGCALVFLGLFVSEPGGGIGELLGIIAAYIAVPFAIGFGIWWLAVKVGRDGRPPIDLKPPSDREPPS
jgi:hypothetical protein